MKIEYRVKPVTRFIVTRWEDPLSDKPEPHNVACARQIGNEYANADMAYEVGYALCRAEHERLGWPIADERIQYPRHPNEANAVEVSAGALSSLAGPIGSGGIA